MSILTPNRSVCDLVVHPSRIHGNGVFATRPFVRGELVFATADFTVLSEPAHGSVQRLPTEHILEPCVLRWVNHSCRHNAEVRFVDDEIQIVCVATIQPHDEVVCDYRLTEDSIPTPFRCNCGHCPGIMIG